MTTEEKAALLQGLRSRDGFTLRRCQILLGSSNRQQASKIAAQLGCSAQTVRNTIRAFEQTGLMCLSAQSSRPKTVQPSITTDKHDQLRALSHQSPRHFDKARSTWTLALLAQVCQEQGITETQLSAVTMHHTLKAMGIDWRRAKA